MEQGGSSEMLAISGVIPLPFKHNPVTAGLPMERLDSFEQALQEAPEEKRRQ